MPFRAEVNRYVNLVETKPQLILRGGRSGLDQQSRDRLAERLAQFSKLYIEVGSGSGRHLIDQADADRTALFLGFELRYKRIFRTAEKAEQRGLDNILLAHCNAGLIPELFGAGTVDGIYVLFPDPWDKRRWKKHRILNPAFLGGVERLLKPGGFLHYKTDHEEYFEETVKLLETVPSLRISALSRDLHSEAPAGNIESEFEKLFKYKRLPVHFIEARRL